MLLIYFEEHIRATCVPPNPAVWWTMTGGGGLDCQFTLHPFTCFIQRNVIWDGYYIRFDIFVQCVHLCILILYYNLKLLLWTTIVIFKIGVIS